MSLGEERSTEVYFFQKQIKGFIFYLLACVCARSCPTLCNPMDCSMPVSSVHGISQAIRVEWVDISYTGGSSQPRDWTHVSDICCVGRQILYCWATWEALFESVKCDCGQPSHPTSWEICLKEGRGGCLMLLKLAMSPQPCVPEYLQFLRPQVPCGRRQEVEDISQGSGP